MALFEFVCKSCGCEFEELITNKSENNVLPCKKCGKDAEKKLSRFSAVIAGGTSNEPVDMTIGREADKRWQMHTDKQSERQKGKTLQTFELPKTEDGKYMPVMGLGDKVEKEKRKEYTVALQDHRQERAKKNQPQFTEAGAF
jgi:putative FmdB family regulatory protein